MRGPFTPHTEDVFIYVLTTSLMFPQNVFWEALELIIPTSLVEKMLFRFLDGEMDHIEQDFYRTFIMLLWKQIIKLIVNYDKMTCNFCDMYHLTFVILIVFFFFFSFLHACHEKVKETKTG